MSRTLLVQLSDEVYASIQREAVAQGTTPACLAAASLETRFSEARAATDEVAALPQAERQAARERFERHFGEVDLGCATGADNESIDADLARQYAGDRGRA